MKLRTLLYSTFEEYENSFFVDMDAMKYSITKALVLYQPRDILAGLYENTGELVALLKTFFSAQVEKNRANEQLKQKEIAQFRQILILLDDVSIIKTIDWNYDIAFVGFKQYLAEKAIDNYSLTIDKEGNTGNTVKAAKRVGLRNVSEVDSLTSYGVRTADMLAGIISKLIKALHNALRYNSDDDYKRKKILGKSWFMVNERQLALYKKMYYVSVGLNNAWYKAFAGIYSDDMIVYIAFLGFMSHFESAEAIKNNLDMQGECFNAYACESLAENYKQMRYKKPIDPLGDISKDYSLNQQGAEVYFDINKQPRIEIRNGQLICDVLSVGYSKEMIPLITIKEGNRTKCYRIPTGLSDWAIQLIGLADMGVDLFPSRVAFTKSNEGCYAGFI